MEITEEHIEAIAGNLETGNLTFLHKQTGEIEWHPDPNHPYLEDEHKKLWEEQFNKIESDSENYLKFEPMDSREAYQVMEDFAESIEDPIYKGRFLERLSLRKPFANFKQLVDNSPYRQDWFDFKSNAYRQYVKKKLKNME